MPERVVDTRCKLGEGPLWHPMEDVLYWVDIERGTLLRYDPATGAYEACLERDEPIGGFTVQADGELLLFMARGAIGLWRQGSLSLLIDELPAERGSRFNDVIADPVGRVFCGTMPTDERPGRLYRLDRDGTLAVVLEDAGLSNGMGFTPDRRHFYHTNTTRRTITRFRYDRVSGNLSEPHVVVRVPQGEGFPDGMTVDGNGDILSARWEGGCVMRHKPDGTAAERIDLPARRVTSVTFAGPDYDVAYVTTAGGDDRSAYGTGAGAVFRIRPRVGGLPEFLSRVEV